MLVRLLLIRVGTVVSDLAQRLKITQGGTVDFISFVECLGQTRNSIIVVVSKLSHIALQLKMPFQSYAGEHSGCSREFLIKKFPSLLYLIFREGIRDLSTDAQFFGLNLPPNGLDDVPLLCEGI